MSLDLRDQLREYGDHFRSALPTVEPEQVVALQPVAAPQRTAGRIPRRRRRLLVAAASAFVVLLLVGGVALFTRPSGGTPPATVEPTTPTTVTSMVDPTVTNQPATTVATAPPGWAAVEVGPAGSGYIADVAAGESGLVAVGYECEGDCSTVSGAVWMSSDGLSWERAAPTTDVFGAGTTLQAVTPGGPGWVAVGLEPGESGSLGAAIWWSEDGRAWQQALPIPGFAGISRVPLGVTVNESQLVAVGTGMDELGIFGRVWSSSDGISWTMTAELRETELLKTRSLGTGFLAFGNAVNDDGDLVVAVWASEDGVEWTQVLQQNEVWNAQAGAIATGTNGAIAVGGMPDAAWISPDGITWTRIEDLTLPMETRAAIADDQGFVVVGRGAWWTSVDGVTWMKTDEELLADAGVSAVVRAGPGLVAVGSQPGQIPTVWLWSPSAG